MADEASDLSCSHYFSIFGTKITALVKMSGLKVHERNKDSYLLYMNTQNVFGVV